MSHFQDGRDFEEEAANAELGREDAELADYEISPGDSARTYTEDDQARLHGIAPGYITVGADDPDLTADAMKALEDRILATVPDVQRDEVQDWISDLLDLAPGQALSPEATRDAARNVLEAARKAKAPRRTLTDAEINAYPRFYPPHEADESGDTGHPCVAIGGNEDDDGAVQAYVYAEDGGVVVSLHFDSAGPTEDDGSGPWAYYGKDGAVPTRVIGGDGQPVYVADQHTPDLSDALTAAAHKWLAKISDAQEHGDTNAVADAGMECAMLLDAFTAITGRPYQPKGSFTPGPVSAAEGEPDA